MSLTLYGFGPNFGLPDPSNFVMKADILMKMSGLPYAMDTSGALNKAPKGKLPFLADGDKKIPDSSLIRQYLEKTYSINFDKSTPQDALASAYMAEKYCENFLYYLMIESRWMNEENFNKGPRIFFTMVPAPIRPFIIWKIRRGMRTMLHSMGISRFTPAELEALTDQGLEKLSLLLGKNPYFGGKEPCGADASIAACLVGLASPYFKSPYPRLIEKYPNLAEYNLRMLSRFYPKEK